MYSNIHKLLFWNCLMSAWNPQFHADQTVYLTHITLQRYCCLHRQPYDDQGMFEPNENVRGILLIFSKSYANPGESQPKQN